MPEVAVGTDQGGRYVLALNAENVVEQRRVQLGQIVATCAWLRVASRRTQRVVVAGILEAVPGQKVDPQLQTSEIRGGGTTRPQ